MAPHPQACVIVCSVLVACGNWAQAQGELTVCTNTRWEWGESGGRRLGKLDPEPRTVFPGDAGMGPCTSSVRIRAQAAKKPGIVGGLRHPHGPSAPAGKNGGALKD